MVGEKLHLFDKSQEVNCDTHEMTFFLLLGNYNERENYVLHLTK